MEEGISTAKRSTGAAVLHSTAQRSLSFVKNRQNRTQYENIVVNRSGGFAIRLQREGDLVRLRPSRLGHSSKLDNARCSVRCNSQPPPLPL